MSLLNAGGIANTTLSSVNSDDVQPNAVDLRLAKVLRVRSDVFEISEDGKTHRGSDPVALDDDGYWTLVPGVYEIVMENIVSVGNGEAGWVITRSTLNRNGVFITSGLYDSGYHGAMAAALHVTTGTMRIKPQTRVGQYVCVQAETLKMYDGSYGIGKVHDQKYA